MRPIDAELLKRTTKRLLEEQENYGFYPKSWDEEVIAFKCLIDSMPTIEAKPVVHAHWEQDGVWDICSNCKRPTLQPHIKGLPQNKYCPNCGAQMDESISCSHEDDNHIAEDGKKGVKIPVISMEDVPKIMEEMEK